MKTAFLSSAGNQLGGHLKRYTQARVAGKIGVSITAVRDWVAGRRRPNDAMCAVMLKKFGIPLTDWDVPAPSAEPEPEPPKVQIIDAAPRSPVDKPRPRRRTPIIDITDPSIPARDRCAYVLGELQDELNSWDEENSVSARMALHKLILDRQKELSRLDGDYEVDFKKFIASSQGQKFQDALMVLDREFRGVAARLAEIMNGL